MLYMLDTNTVSYLLRGQYNSIENHLKRVSISDVCLSAITEAELLRGVEKKPEATNLARLVHAFLIRTNVLPWDSKVAKEYALLRTACESEGKSLSAMDMLIAAHSLAVGATLITNDTAFYNVQHFLNLEDWTLGDGAIINPSV